jgi:hypothetical protein
MLFMGFIHHGHIFVVLIELFRVNDSFFKGIGVREELNGYLE